jgi:hypothetical protein
MAETKKITKYDVNPMELPGGILEGLSIQRTERVTRVADNGRVLDYGHTVNVGDPLEIPISKIGQLIADLVSWPIYFSNGDAAREDGARLWEAGQ